VPLDQQEYYKDISISYQLAKTGFSLGETPTIAGEIYNSGSSAAKLKVGIDIIQVYINEQELCSHNMCCVSSV